RFWRGDRGVLPLLTGRQDDDTALVDQHAVARQLAPSALGFLDVDLHGRHAPYGFAAAKRIRQVVARLAARDADAVEAATPVLDGVVHIGPERQVLADCRAGLVPIRCGHGGATAV